MQRTCINQSVAAGPLTLQITTGKRFQHYFFSACFPKSPQRSGILRHECPGHVESRVPSAPHLFQLVARLDISGGVIDPPPLRNQAQEALQRSGVFSSGVARFRPSAAPRKRDSLWATIPNPGELFRTKLGLLDPNGRASFGGRYRNCGRKIIGIDPKVFRSFELSGNKICRRIILAGEDQDQVVAGRFAHSSRCNPYPEPQLLRRSPS